MESSGYHHIMVALVIALGIAVTGCQKELNPDPPSNESEPAGLQLDGVEGFLDTSTHTLMFPLPADTVSG